MYLAVSKNTTAKASEEHYLNPLTPKDGLLIFLQLMPDNFTFQLGIPLVNGFHLHLFLVEVLLLHKKVPAVLKELESLIVKEKIHCDHSLG